MEVTILKNAGTYKKIYHVSDIHIENTDDRIEEYKSIFTKLHSTIKKENNNDSLLCVVGDLIDFNNNITVCGVSMLTYFLKHFSEVCDIVIISGNHDANVNDIEELDLIECLYSNVESDHNIYYLKKSGMYKINNLMLSVVSVFDRKIIDVKQYKKQTKYKDNIFVALHHGYVVSDDCDTTKMPFDMTETKFFRGSDFNGYDIVLLGDIHKNLFITQNIAYCSSMIQRNYGESIGNHGYIKWNLETCIGTFMEITSDYARASIICKNGKLCDMPKLPPNVSIKIKLDDTDRLMAEKRIAKLIKKYNIKNVKYEETITKFKMKTLGGTEIKVFDMTNKTTLDKLMEDYMTNILKIGKDDIKFSKIFGIHNKYFEEMKTETKNRKKINFRKMFFSNLCSFGDNNSIDFNTHFDNILIKGKNGYGKSSILDILCFALFDKTLRYGNSKYDILNTTQTNGYVSLNFEIDGNIYEITKELKILEKKQIIVAKLVKNGITLNMAKSSVDDYITNLFGLKYEEFVFLCTMPKNSRNEFLDRSNAEKKDLISQLLNIHYLSQIEKKVRTHVEKLTKIHNDNAEYNRIIDNYDENIVIDDNKYNVLNTHAQKLMRHMKRIASQIKDLEKKIKYVDDPDNEIDLIKQIADAKFNIAITNTTIGKINKNILDVRGQHSQIKIPDDIKNSIKQCFAKKNQSNDDKLNSILFSLIENNMEFVQDIHKKEIELISQKNSCDIKILELENIIANCEAKMSQCKKRNKLILTNRKIMKSIEEKKTLLKVKEKQTYDVYCDIYKIDEMRQKHITKQQYDDAIKKTETVKNDIDIYSTYLKILNINGLALYVFNMTCSHIQHISNQILRKIGLEYTILFEFDTKTKNDHVIADIDIYKMSGGNKVIAYGVSTSEKFFINLAIKIALQKILNVSSPSFLLIDEKFEEVDQVKLKNIADIFDVLHETYDKLFVISHLNQVAQHCSKTIAITQENNFSKIFTNQ